MTTLPTLNRARVELLTAVAAGRVYRSLGGMIVHKANRGANNQRVDRRIRELMNPDVAWVREPADGDTAYALTPAGEAALAEVTHA